MIDTQKNTGHGNIGDYNTGDRNTGYRNSGDRNTGDRNTGYYNTGYWNTGDRNTGNWNSGNRNTGYWNTGYYNTGYWNIGNRHVGCFNTIDAPMAYYFNKLLPVTDWEETYKPDWLYQPSLTTWVSSNDMTDQEKTDHSEHETTGGYLRVNDMKDEWRKAYESASFEDREAVKKLPGFDAEVFFEITGLDLRETPKAAPCEGREIEIDGVTYVLKAKENTDD